MSALVPIAHFERKYAVSSNGRVWNKGKEAWQSQTQNPNGYWKVLLSLNGKREQFLVHRLVALHFLPNPYGHEQVNHKDGNKSNNSVSNLEWASRSENIQHSLEAGLRKGFMSQEERRPLLERVLGGETIAAVSAELGRRPEGLTKMLRDQAKKDGRFDEWTVAMRIRRTDTAVRNLERANAAHSFRRQSRSS